MQDRVKQSVYNKMRQAREVRDGRSGQVSLVAVPMQVPVVWSDMIARPLIVKGVMIAVLIRELNSFVKLIPNE